MNVTVTRETFAARRAKAQAIRQTLGRLTATVAVVLGVGQLGFIRLTQGRMVAEKVLPFEVALVTAYLVVVGFLVWRMDREVDKARPSCPSCTVVYRDAQADVVMATGACPACGARVID